MKPYTLPDLAYDYGALEPHYSARILELHHDKHHKAYVDGVNVNARQARRGARGPTISSAIVGLEKTLAFNLSGHVLHTLFWQNLGPDNAGPPGRRARRRDRRALRLVRGVPQAALPSAASSVQGSGRARLTGSRSASGSSSSRSTTTRATRARAACRCS